MTERFARTLTAAFRSNRRHRPSRTPRKTKRTAKRSFGCVPTDVGPVAPRAGWLALKLPLRATLPSRTARGMEPWKTYDADIRVKAVEFARQDGDPRPTPRHEALDATNPGKRSRAPAREIPIEAFYNRERPSATSDRPSSRTENVPRSGVPRDLDPRRRCPRAGFSVRRRGTAKSLQRTSQAFLHPGSARRPPGTRTVLGEARR
ncbi:hypothetical protein DES52_11858 [Deinococcus yavapaiensis KR-236]|uniref:Transposase n=1 Tax=Deinococcus yavapaiensis KR-236 TaxID=694435 RepID=A0A318S6S9_9DEIO|nr:hypothetical protein DES52_11858 [Deinococcus yavapaiensis KR-236]